MVRFDPGKDFGGRDYACLPIGRDRIIHKAHRIDLEGESMSKKKGKEKD